MGRVILSAISSGSGKTTITCGLLKELKKRGLNVKAYKCGPDYIDPMFHKKVLGIPSENLDLFFSDKDYISEILAKNNWADISVIEGAMGIYDGILGLSSEGSVYDLAVKTATPIVLIVDAAGIGNTLISVIKGILIDDKEGLIKGIILNRISEHFYLSIASAIERESGIKVLGFIRKQKNISIDSRHLGLKLPEEIEELGNQIEIVRAELAEKVDVDGIISIAANAKEINSNKSNSNDCIQTGDKLRLALAYDEAFCFYYEDNFRLLKNAMVDIVFFSPIHDKELPDNISGILLGGGYPELRLQELEENISMRKSIKDAIDRGIPLLAECGGFMYLHDSVEDEKGSYSMVGAIEGKCFNTGKLTRFGYADFHIADRIIKGHEFHYYDSTNNGEVGRAIKPGNKKQWIFGHGDIKKGRLWGFPHLYYGSCPEFVDDFVRAMKEFKERSIDG